VIELKKFYITTPIYYVNDVPHIGHAYTTIASDILARWNRILGKKVFFLTGLDENSAKTVQAARERGFADIKKYTDEMAKKWAHAWKILNISNDDFIRTTEPRHRKNVIKFFKGVYKKGDIYKGKYEGLYCDDCEAFLTESDMVDGRCPLHKKEPRHIIEDNYFFRLSKYQGKILKLYEKNKGCILPESRMNEVLSFIRAGVKDISISRPKKEWGIQLPIDKNHVIWVWFDALINYLLPEKFWPADLHVMAKDILRFHCIIWPGMLLSAGYRLPKRYFVHGFMTINGQKISKSLGNAIDPVSLAEKYSADALRYFLFRELPFGADGDFSEESLLERRNSELADNFSNLFYRATYFTEKNFHGKVPKPGRIGKEERGLQKAAKKAVNEYSRCMEKYDLSNALKIAMNLSSETNKYFQGKKPWETIKTKKSDCATTLYTAINTLRIISTLLYPYMPYSSEKALELLNAKQARFKDLSKFTIKPGQKIKAEILFKKMEKSEEEKQSKLNLKIGTIISVEDHPDAEKLYVIHVDLGSETRQIVAGLKANYKKEELEGKQVVMVTNLEPKELRGIESQGMLLAAEPGIILSPGEKVENGTNLLGFNYDRLISFKEFQDNDIHVIGGHDQAVLCNGKKLKAQNILISPERPVKNGAKVL